MGVICDFFARKITACMKSLRAWENKHGLDEILVAPGIEIAHYLDELEPFYFFDEFLDRFTDDLLRLGTRAHNATRAEDGKYRLRFFHTINQARIPLGLIAG